MEKPLPIDSNSPEIDKLRLQRMLENADKLEIELINKIDGYEADLKEDKDNGYDPTGTGDTEELLEEAQNKLKILRQEKQKITEELQKIN